MYYMALQRRHNCQESKNNVRFMRASNSHRFTYYHPSRQKIFPVINDLMNAPGIFTAGCIPEKRLILALQLQYRCRFPLLPLHRKANHFSRHSRQFLHHRLPLSLCPSLLLCSLVLLLNDLMTFRPITPIPRFLAGTIRPLT